MFTESLSDPTAGQSAQLRRLEPDVPQPILDPTDPRYGSAEFTHEPERPALTPVRRPAAPRPRARRG
jgi:hypothetical protein